MLESNTLKTIPLATAPDPKSIEAIKAMPIKLQLLLKAKLLGNTHYSRVIDKKLWDETSELGISGYQLFRLLRGLVKDGLVKKSHQDTLRATQVLNQKTTTYYEITPQGFKVLAECGV